MSVAEELSTDASGIRMNEEPARGLSLIARNGSAAPGQMVSVDVFLDNATSLRGFQVAVDSILPPGVELELVDVSIDESRTDYIFYGRQNYTSADLVGGRLCGAIGPVPQRAPVGTTTSPAGVYLGTFTFRVDGDSSGTGSIRLRGSDTLLRRATMVGVPHRESQSADVTVGAP